MEDDETNLGACLTAEYYERVRSGSPKLMADVAGPVTVIRGGTAGYTCRDIVGRCANRLLISDTA